MLGADRGAGTTLPGVILRSPSYRLAAPATLPLEIAHPAILATNAIHIPNSSSVLATYARKRCTTRL